MIWLNKFQINWKISSKFCGLLKNLNLFHFFFEDGTKVKIPSEIKLHLMAPFALYPAYPPAFWLPHKGWIKLACGAKFEDHRANSWNAVSALHYACTISLATDTQWEFVFFKSQLFWANKVYNVWVKKKLRQSTAV